MNNDVMQDSCPGPNCDVQRQFYSLTTKIVDGADALTDIFVEGMTPHSAIQSVMAFRGGIPVTVNGHTLHLTALFASQTIRKMQSWL